jgi:Rrf2 family transcriptional regulator, cysteine metabolism repressor
MFVSQKCQYTLRALFELAKRRGSGPVTVAEIAQAQAIPARFLEVILQGLKNGGHIQSLRGTRGGYVLASLPETITVGNIIRMTDGSLAPTDCHAPNGTGDCRLMGRCAFLGLWHRAREAVEQVYDATTLQDLIDGEPEESVAARCATDYCI